MKILLLIIFSVCFCLSGISQILTVLDFGTKKPIELATISCEKAKVYALTNDEGQADINAFKGSEKIQVRILGYETKAFSFSEIEKENFIVYLNPSVFQLDKVVVSATKWNQSTGDIPAKVITISPKEMKLLAPQTAADLLSISGEVFIQKSQQGGGSPMIRGFATNRLLYTVDGVRMNTAIFRSGNIQNVISLDPFATEKTEIFFGPGSIIYGSDAIGGVMSFQTLTPQVSLNNKTYIKGSAVTRYSSANDEKTIHFDINAGWKKWAMLTSISSSDYGDLRMGSDGPDEYLCNHFVQRIDSNDVVVSNNEKELQRPSGYKQINMMEKIRFKASEKLDFQYGFHYSTTSDYSRYDRLLQMKNGLPKYAEWNYGPQIWMMNNLSISHDGFNAMYDQLTVRAAHQQFEESRISRGLNKDTREIRTEKVSAISLNIDLNKSLGQKGNLFYGLELVHNDVTSTGEDEDITSGEIAVGPSRYPQSTWASYAAYLNYQYKFSEKFMVQAGTRYNQYVLNCEFDTTFYKFPFTKTEMNKGSQTGSIGVVVSPVEKLTVYSNLSTGFRSPNVDDVGKVFDSEPGSVVVPNPDLESEYSYNVDLGIAKVFGNICRIDVSAYYTILKNALVRRDFVFNGADSIIYDGEMSKVQAIQNAAEATVKGVQAEIDIRLPYGFGLSSRYNYQKGEEELDDGTTSPLRHAAPAFGITHLTYSEKNLKLDLYGMYAAEVKFENLPQEEQGKDYMYAVDADGNPYCPSWFTLNFKAMYQFTDNFIITGGVENITNIRYRPYSSGIVSPGRNLVLSLKAKF